HPIHVVFAFAKVECPLQIGIALCVDVHRRNTEALGKVDGGVFIALRKHPEYDSEYFAIALQFPHGDGDVVAGMETEIESQVSLTGSNDTGYVFPRIRRLQNG